MTSDTFGAHNNSMAPQMKSPRISRQGRAVLFLVVAQPDQWFRVIDVAERCSGSYRSRGSARASLSRTLRRLQRGNLIELATASRTTFTAYHADIDRQLARVERDAEAAFQRAVAKRGGRCCSNGLLLRGREQSIDRWADEQRYLK